MEACALLELGILGYGRLGRIVGRLGVLAWDRKSGSGSMDGECQRCPLEELLARSDVLSVHLRLSDESRGLLNRSILINTARGQILDEDALAEALREKRIPRTRAGGLGSGLDLEVPSPRGWRKEKCSNQARAARVTRAPMQERLPSRSGDHPASARTQPPPLG